MAEEAVRATEADFGNVNLYDLYEDKMIEQADVIVGIINIESYDSFAFTQN